MDLHDNVEKLPDGILYATHRLIDSVWTLGYTIDNDKDEVNIYSYDRDNKIGYEKEKDLPKVSLVEDGDTRIVRFVIINKKMFTVTNPQHIFSYKRK